jgi:hypothetical protein
MDSQSESRSGDSAKLQAARATGKLSSVIAVLREEARAETPRFRIEGAANRDAERRRDQPIQAQFSQRN